MEHLILVTVLRFASVAVLDVVSVAVAVLDVGWFCWPWTGVVGGTSGRDQIPEWQSLLLTFTS